MTITNACAASMRIDGDRRPGNSNECAENSSLDAGEEPRRDHPLVDEERAHPCARRRGVVPQEGLMLSPSHRRHTPN
jgi:hypothetical protein